MELPADFLSLGRGSVNRFLRRVIAGDSSPLFKVLQENRRKMKFNWKVLE